MDRDMDVDQVSSPDIGLGVPGISEMPIDVESINEDVEDGDEFSFETDHVMFRNNKDYLNLLKIITILEAQRIQAVNDMQTVLEIKEYALKNPMLFVQKMENGESLGIPSRIVLPKLPIIDWTDYSAEEPECLKYVTRNATKLPVVVKEEDDQRKAVTVRGRAFDRSKPETFNQLWTMEEQQRLEELLVEFPPEEVETKRWGKIAAALGNRTSKQVSSRVQKYFIKLHRAGLPVPGRIPKVVGMGYRHQHQRNNYMLFKPTTFFPARPRMSDYESIHRDKPKRTEVPSTSVVEQCDDDESEGDEEEEEEDDAIMNIKEKVAEANTSRLISLISNVAEEKEVSGDSTVKHFGYKCDYCHEEPLIGTRWHCLDCDKTSIDFCSDCIVTQVYSTNPHNLSHRLEPIRAHVRPKTYDQDYAGSLCGDNYLDPNFMPGNDE